MNWKSYLQSLLQQKAELQDAIQADKSFMISPEKHELLFMLGCVESQIKSVKARILTNEVIDSSLGR